MPDDFEQSDNFEKVPRIGEDGPLLLFKFEDILEVLVRAIRGMSYVYDPVREVQLILNNAELGPVAIALPVKAAGVDSARMIH